MIMARYIFESAPLRMNPAKVLCSNNLRSTSGFLLLFSLVTNRQKNKNVIAVIQIELEDKMPHSVTFAINSARLVMPTTNKRMPR